MKHFILVAAILSFIGHLFFMMYKPDFTDNGFVNVCIMGIPAILYILLIHWRIVIVEKEMEEKSKKKNCGED